MATSNTFLLVGVDSLWPHLIIPTVFILFFTLPPFPHRATLLTLFSVSMIHPCLFDPVENALPIRYGLVTVWLLYAGWLAKMFFHRPEHDFWRRGKPEHEAERMGFGWEKFKWALSLLFSWRGVGWNFQPDKLPAPRNKLGRWDFVIRELARAVVCYLGTDAATVYLQRSRVDSGYKSVAELGLGRQAAMEAAIGVSIWLTHQGLYALCGALMVAFGLYDEEDFLPLFGDITAVHSLGAFWGQFWHQNYRLIFTDYAHAVAHFLRIPHRSLLYWPLHVWTASIMSGLIHALPMWSLVTTSPDGGHSPFTSVFLFFILQGVGMTLETMFFISPGEDILLYEIGEPDVWIMGRLWTLSWLLVTGRLLLECFWEVGDGMIGVPVSIVPPVLSRIS